MTTPLVFPQVFCEAMPGCQPIPIPLPFGLPPQNFIDPCCRGIELTLGDLTNMLKPFYPLLQLVGCLTKLIDIVMAIPDALGPPPSPSKIAGIVSMIGQFVSNCLPFIITLTPAGFVPAFACMLKGYIFLLIGLLNCLMKVITVNINISADALLLSQSGDPFLVDMGVCLTNQGSVLAQSLVDKLSSLTNVFGLLNTVCSIVPGLSSVHIVPDFSSTDPLVLNDELKSTIVVLNAVYQTVSVLCV